MSKNRMINTKFWSDGWIINLEPLERYLYLYFLTNEHTNICGIYELPVGVISRESGLKNEEIIKILKRLEEKIDYLNGWICIKNFQKHQKASGNIKLGIEKGMSEVPEEILAGLREKSDTPSSDPDTAGTQPVILKEKLKGKEKLNLNLNLKLKRKESELSELSPSQVSKDFFQNPEEIIKGLLEKGLPEPAVRKEIAKFVSYWTEPNKSGTKQRWELQKTFEVKRRLTTWFGNIREFQNNSNVPKAVRIS